MTPTPLPRGITGFDFPPHNVSFSDFVASCKAAATVLKGEAGGFRNSMDEQTPNFHQALLSVPGHPVVRVACNQHYPIVAFATPPRQGEMLLEFVDFPELAFLLSHEFTVMTAADAEAPISDAVIVNLGPAELNQMKYWSRCYNRVGDLIFNWWD